MSDFVSEIISHRNIEEAQDTTLISLDKDLYNYARYCSSFAAELGLTLNVNRSFIILPAKLTPESS